MARKSGRVIFLTNLKSGQLFFWKLSCKNHFLEEDNQVFLVFISCLSLVNLYQHLTLHYAARAAIWKKSYHEMFNFENWFLCQFSSNTRFSFGGGSLNTPKIGKCKKEFTNINLRGFKTQKTWRGCLLRIKRVSKVSFLYMLWYLLS